MVKKHKKHRAITLVMAFSFLSCGLAAQASTAKRPYAIGSQSVSTLVAHTDVFMSDWLQQLSVNSAAQIGTNIPIKTTLLASNQRGLYLVGVGTTSIPMNGVQAKVPIVFAALGGKTGCAKSMMMIAVPYKGGTILSAASQIQGRSLLDVRFRGAMCQLKPTAVPGTNNYTLDSSDSTTIRCLQSASNEQSLTWHLTNDPYFSQLPAKISPNDTDIVGPFCDKFIGATINSG